MTTGGVEVDLDRLADFVGGALDGTPEAADVRRLVSTDSRWAEAYAALVNADVAMRDELRAWGTEAPAVPDDVLARLDAALAGAAAARTADAANQSRSPAGDELADRRRRQRWLVGLATAAAVLVCGFAGVTSLQRLGEQRNATATSDSGKVASNAKSPLSAQGGSGQSIAVVITGNDYSPSTLARVGTKAAPPAVTSGGEGSPPSPAAGSKENMLDVPRALSRLIDPDARAACLDAIVREYGGRVALVDFARFNGAPALVVVVDDAPAAVGKRLVVVVGPACGQGNAITDERYRAAV